MDVYQIVNEQSFSDAVAVILQQSQTITEAILRQSTTNEEPTNTAKKSQDSISISIILLFLTLAVVATLFL